MMTTHSIQASAKIYQFPVKGRTISVARTDAATARTASNAPLIMSGAGWYHDAAIQETQRPGKR